MTEFDKEGCTDQQHSGDSFLSHLHFSLPGFKTNLIFWPLVITGLALDLWSKSAIFEWLSEKDSYSFSIIDGFLRLVMAVNSGAAFGIAAGQRYLLILISFAAMIVVFGVFFFARIKRTIIYVALGLFTAGVCGNLYDRIFNDGMVRDFIDIYYGTYHWPAFNVADSMLCIGVSLMVISSLTDNPGQKLPQQQK